MAEERKIQGAAVAEACGNSQERNMVARAKNHGREARSRTGMGKVYGKFSPQGRNRQKKPGDPREGIPRNGTGGTVPKV